MVTILIVTMTIMITIIIIIVVMVIEIKDSLTGEALQAAPKIIVLKIPGSRFQTRTIQNHSYIRVYAYRIILPPARPCEQHHG